jgi:hypothetical protein
LSSRLRALEFVSVVELRLDSRGRLRMR